MGIIIEAGKFYATKNGLKVRIYSVDGTPDAPVHGAFLGPKGWNARLWTHEGTALFAIELDIIDPWIEKPIVDWSAMPKWGNYVAMDKNGKWHWYALLPSISPDSCGMWKLNTSSTFCGFIPPGFHPQFGGDWNQSLAERPTP